MAAESTTLTLTAAQARDLASAFECALAPLEVVAFFGLSTLAKELYEQLGIEAVERVQ